MRVGSDLTSGVVHRHKRRDNRVGNLPQYWAPKLFNFEMIFILTQRQWAKRIGPGWLSGQQPPRGYLTENCQSQSGRIQAGGVAGVPGRGSGRFCGGTPSPCVGKRGHSSAPSCSRSMSQWLTDHNSNRPPHLHLLSWRSFPV